MTKPNLFIAGAQKSGTSTLHRMLAKHPDIYMSQQKELNFFNQPDIGEKDFDKYLEHFSNAKDEKYVGEATPHYYSSNANNDGKSAIADRIARFVGTDITLVMILRNPVERALAGWRHNFVHGKLDTSTSIFDAPKSMGILELSHYARHWETWAQVFGEEKIHIFLYDTLSAYPKFLLREVLDELDLPFNEADYKNFPFEKPANKVTDNMERNKVPLLPGFDLDVIKQLVDRYEADISHVEKIMGQNLKHWRNAGEISKRFQNIGRVG